MATFHPQSIYQDVERRPQPRNDWARNDLVFYMQTAAALTEALRRGTSPLAYQEFWHGVDALQALVGGASPSFVRWRPEDILNWRVAGADEVDNILSKMYAEGTARASSRGLYEIVCGLFDMQEGNYFQKIDGLLVRSDTRKLAPEFLLALLRTTFVERDSIPAWKAFLDRAEAELVARGRQDTDELLQGLRERS